MKGIAKPSTAYSICYYYSREGYFEKKYFTTEIAFTEEEARKNFVRRNPDCIIKWMDEVKLKS